VSPEADLAERQQQEQEQKDQEHQEVLLDAQCCILLHPLSYKLIIPL